MLSVQLRHQLGGFALDARLESARDTGVLALTGPSGAGKSSVLRGITGLIRPDGGRVVVDGRVLFDRAAGIDVPVHDRRLGVVFQDSRLFPHLSVRANLDYGRRTRAQPQQTRFDDVVQLLGIDHLLGRRPRALSGGERQRVAIGRALLTHPTLLVLDEPLASLDGGRKQELLPFLAALPRELAVPIVYVSHDLDELLQVADELAVMSHGRVVAQGPVTDTVSAMGGSAAVDTVVEGVVVDSQAGRRIRLRGGAQLHALGLAGLAPGQRLRARIPADDVLLAVGAVPATSVRNCLAARVRGLAASERGWVVELELETATEIRLRARVSRAAVDELGLEPGRPVTAMVKAASIRIPGLSRGRPPLTPPD